MSSLKTKPEDEPKEWRKRQKRRHELIVCDIELENGSIDRDLIGRLVCEILKYLLYDRQQIPFPLSNSKSLQQLNQKSVEKQLSPKEEQLLVTIEDLNQVFIQLIGLITNNDIPIDCVSLSLGQTLQMPKELYCIQLPNPDIYSVVHSTDCRTLTLRSAVTRFFKSILNDKNILFQNRKDIPMTKLFVLIKTNKCYAKQVMEQSMESQQNDSHCADSHPFTPHMDYEMPKMGNRFKLTLNQKPCDCRRRSAHSFEIFDETIERQNDCKYLDKQLSQTMSDVLTLSDSISEKKSNESSGEYIWIQIHSSIKGIQYNSNKSVY